MLGANKDSWGCPWQAPDAVGRCLMSGPGGRRREAGISDPVVAFAGLSSSPGLTGLLALMPTIPGTAQEAPTSILEGEAFLAKPLCCKRLRPDPSRSKQRGLCGFQELRRVRL